MVSADLGGKDTMLTAIVAVNYKEDTLVLDYGASDYLNKKLISTPHVKFTTGFNGIQVAFTGGIITKTKYQGEDAFVMPIPHSLFWYNRREYYRINTPIMNPSLCVIKLKAPEEDTKKSYIDAYEIARNVIKRQLIDKIQDEIAAEQQAFAKAFAKMSVQSKIQAKIERQKFEAERAANPIKPDENEMDLITLPLHDVSLSGFSMTNYQEEFSFFLERGLIYENCKLIMPNHGEVNVSIEIMVKRKTEGHRIGEFAELVGVKLINTRQSAESMVLRYIQDLERQSGVLNI